MKILDARIITSTSNGQLELYDGCAWGAILPTTEISLCIKDLTPVGMEGFSAVFSSDIRSIKNTFRV